MATAAIMVNAANLAYRRVGGSKIREKGFLEQHHHPRWMSHFADGLPENHVKKLKKLKETVFQSKKRLLSTSTAPYERLAWYVYRYVVNKAWFEAFVMCNIVLIGAATGLDLENSGRSASINLFVEVSSNLTMVVFSCECALKIIAEAYQPRNYFTDPENGAFNTFDFVIVVAGFAFIGNTNGGAVGALRMLRLIRLLTFIKGVPQLRVIISGLIQGLKSVTYIVMLLFLIIYMFAIMGALVFGINDPARFGTVPMAMVSLFQVSTLASWTSIAYTSWYGCGNFQGDQYALVAGTASLKASSVMHTSMGSFEGYMCDSQSANALTTFFFYHIYIVLTSWVIMSLFIGVISMGMFEAFHSMSAANREIRKRKKLDENMDLGDYDFEVDSDVNDENGGESKDEGIAIGGENDLTAQRALAAKGKNKKRGPKKSLREMIDFVLEDEHEEHIHGSWAEKVFAELCAACLVIRENAWFNNIITVTIIVVGLVIGMDTDKFLICERLQNRMSGRDEAREVYKESFCVDNMGSNLVGLLSQLIFTAECAIKILAEGNNPAQYFNAPGDGGWNSLDFFVVTMGYVEMSPLSFIFNAFPVVILRLLRLLRVFRLAKALPRLRSIVEALISGFSAVGWICVLIVAFNYIAACMCMLFLRENDPFHFGSVGRSMFTILRIETLDTWDQTLYVSMFGCASYPAAYPFVDESINPNVSCRNDNGLGWAAAAIFFVIVIIGSYILPTVLIGIVTISFDEATRKAEALQEMLKGMEKVVVEAEASVPGFFTPERVNAIRNVFDAMDTDGGLTLDLKEVSPFYHYAFARVFGVSLDREHTDALFHLMDMDANSELDFPEFIMAVMVVKQIEKRCKDDDDFRRSSFPDSVFNQADMDASSVSNRKLATWTLAVKQMDEVTLEDAWIMIFKFLGEGDGEAGEEHGCNPEQTRKMKQMFEAYDVDGNLSLDSKEITNGLISFGVHINERQSVALIKSMDENGDGCVSFEELMLMVGKVRRHQLAAKSDQNEADTIKVLDNLEPGMGSRLSEIRESQGFTSFEKNGRVSGGRVSDGKGSNDGSLDDNDKSLEEVIEICAQRIANRMVFESVSLSKKETPMEATNTTSAESGCLGDESKRKSDEKQEQPAVTLSLQDVEDAQTLKGVLKSRALEEFSTFQHPRSQFVTRTHIHETSSVLSIANNNNEGSILDNLVTRTLNITRGAKGQSITDSKMPHLNVNHLPQQQRSRKQQPRYPPVLPMSPRGNVLPWSALIAQVVDPDGDGGNSRKRSVPLYANRNRENANDVVNPEFQDQKTDPAASKNSAVPSATLSDPASHSDDQVVDGDNALPPLEHRHESAVASRLKSASEHNNRGYCPNGGGNVARNLNMKIQTRTGAAGVLSPVLRSRTYNDPTVGQGEFGRLNSRVTNDGNHPLKDMNNGTVANSKHSQRNSSNHSSAQSTGNARKPLSRNRGPDADGISSPMLSIVSRVKKTETKTAPGISTSTSATSNSNMRMANSASFSSGSSPASFQKHRDSSLGKETRRLPRSTSLTRNPNSSATSSVRIEEGTERPENASESARSEATFLGAEGGRVKLASSPSTRSQTPRNPALDQYARLRDEKMQDTGAFPGSDVRKAPPFSQSLKRVLAGDTAGFLARSPLVPPSPSPAPSPRPPLITQSSLAPSPRPVFFPPLPPTTAKKSFP